MIILLLLTTLTYAETQVRIHALALGVTDSIQVVSTTSDVCYTPRGVCMAWVTHSRIGWIIGFTPGGLKRSRQSVNLSAAHEVCHIVHHGRLLKDGSWSQLAPGAIDYQENVAWDCAMRLTR